MFLLVPAHSGCPGQNPQSRKSVVCVCVYLSVLQMSSSDRVLLTAFREIGQMADRLNLPKMIAVSSSAHYAS